MSVLKILTIIGLVLTGIITIPLILFLIICEAAIIYRDYKDRPDAPPPSKDDWKVM